MFIVRMLSDLSVEREYRAYGSPRARGRRFCCGLAHLLEPQVSRTPPFAFGLHAIARHGVIGPWQPPVGSALRGPDEIRRARQMRQCPCAIIVDIADETKFAIRHEG